MDQRDDRISQLVNALPNHFQFYHFGEVEMKPSPLSLGDAPANAWDDFSAVLFHIYGDLRAVLLLLFPRELNPSLYSEMGNIIASRLATQINQQNDIEIMISPPQPVTEGQLQWVIEQKDPAFHRTYAHLYKNSVISIETFVLPGPLEEVGYA